MITLLKKFLYDETFARYMLRMLGTVGGVAVVSDPTLLEGVLAPEWNKIVGGIALAASQMVRSKPKEG